MHRGRSQHCQEPVPQVRTPAENNGSLPLPLHNFLLLLFTFVISLFSLSINNSLTFPISSLFSAFSLAILFPSPFLLYPSSPSPSVHIFLPLPLCSSSPFPPFSSPLHVSGLLLSPGRLRSSVLVQSIPRAKRPVQLV